MNPMLRRLLHWARCHSVLLVLAGFVLVGLVWRGTLFGIQTAPPALSQSSSGRPLHPAPPAVERASSPATMPIGNPASEPAMPQVVQIPESATMRAAEQGNQKTTDATRPLPETVTPQLPPVTVTDADLPAAELPEAEFPVTSPDRTPIPADEEAAAAADELLRQARRLYWEGRFAAAEGRYRSYLERRPDDLEVRGELADLLYLDGRRDAADTAYRELIGQLRARGEMAAAERLRRLLPAGHAAAAQQQ